MMDYPKDADAHEYECTTHGAECPVLISEFLETAKQQARKDAASEIFGLAHQFAQNDKTMIGSEELRNYHYFNAISEVGGFPGR